MPQTAAAGQTMIHSDRPHVTRLAPSPTGALHLGNARTFLANWLLARQEGWTILLRIEDLDGPRIKRGADKQAIEDLKWLGIDWDQGPIYQSTRKAKYDLAIDRLITQGAAYSCICSRRDARLAAAAPHEDDSAQDQGPAVYPGTCRGRFASIADAAQSAGHPPAIRFRVPPGLVEFEDRFAGHVQIDAARELGDFVIRKADGTAAYQLAVVVDDAEAKVTQVVRGSDLLLSTPWQILLYDALDLAADRPQYTHLPLVVGPDGRRLAKRHGDTRLSHYRDRGVPASRMIALLARWLGIESSNPQKAADLLGRFDLTRVPRAPIIADEHTEHFLLHGAAA
jgi:glutamyl-tRNA synthetase